MIKYFYVHFKNILKSINTIFKPKCKYVIDILAIWFKFNVYTNEESQLLFKKKKICLHTEHIL